MNKVICNTILICVTIALAGAILLMLSGRCCAMSVSATSDQILAQQQEESMKEAAAQLGAPAIVNFQEKRVAKMIYELRDRADLVCYAYIVNQMTGKLVFIGKCVGYGLPYSTQYSNPQKYTWGTIGGVRGNSILMPQAEPNGLFMPEGLSATWLLMINPETNEPTPVYIEPEILVSPFKMH